MVATRGAATARQAGRPTTDAKKHGGESAADACRDHGGVKK
jgi:hypothetical protein